MLRVELAINSAAASSKIGLDSQYRDFDQMKLSGNMELKVNYCKNDEVLINETIKGGSFLASGWNFDRKMQANQSFFFEES